jgi:hypothetical protein
MVAANGADTGEATAPDPIIIRAHLDKLFKRCPDEYPGGLCEIAWSEPGKWAIVNAQSFAATPDGLTEATTLGAALNAAGSNVYVGVNPRKPGAPDHGRCRAEHVEIAFFQFCECDKPESLDLLRHSPLPYSLFVITGRTPNARVHGYHELVDAIRNMPLWRRRQEAERDYCRGDNVVDPARLMRLAGTVNYPAPHKAARGYQAEVVELHCTRARPISDVDFDFGPFANVTIERPKNPARAAPIARTSTIRSRTISRRSMLTIIGTTTVGTWSPSSSPRGMTGGSFWPSRRG